MQSDEKRRAVLERALDRIATSFVRRTIPIDGAIADRWGRITALNTNVGRRSIDALLAATVQERGLLLVTRNVRDFENLGIEFLNPWPH